MRDTVIGSDAGMSKAPGKDGFWYEWGPQAWIDMFMSNSMLVKKAMPIVTHSLLPILRLSGDKEQIDRDYKAIKLRRESVRWSDSPRQKWRKRYGGVEKTEIRKMRELEKENTELKKALGEHVIMLNATKEVLKKRGWD